MARIIKGVLWMIVGDRDLETLRESISWGPSTRSKDFSVARIVSLARELLKKEAQLIKLPGVICTDSF